MRRPSRWTALAAGGALAGLVALPALAADPAGTADAPVLAAPTLRSFCAALSGIVAAEAARERNDFAPSLAKAVAEARRGLDRRVAMAAAGAEEDEGAPPLRWEAEDALAAGRYLWQRWMPISPAAKLAVVGERPDDWLIAPAPGAEPPYTGEPIHVAKADGSVTWKLPHPSERERLYRALCGEPAGE